MKPQMGQVATSRRRVDDEEAGATVGPAEQPVPDGVVGAPAQAAHVTGTTGKVVVAVRVIMVWLGFLVCFCAPDDVTGSSAARGVSLWTARDGSPERLDGPGGDPGASVWRSTGVSRGPTTLPILRLDRGCVKRDQGPARRAGSRRATRRWRADAPSAMVRGLPRREHGLRCGRSPRHRSSVLRPSQGGGPNR